MILLVMFVEMSTNVSRILWIFLSEYNRFDTGIRCSLPDSFYKHKWIESRSSFLKYCFVFTNCEINNHQPYDLYIFSFSRSTRRRFRHCKRGATGDRCARVLLQKSNSIRNKRSQLIDPFHKLCSYDVKRRIFVNVSYTPLNVCVQLYNF